MEFGWTKAEEEFRTRIQEAFATHARPGWTHHDRDMPTIKDRDDSIAFCQALADEQLLTPHWPEEYGGRSASGWEQAILGEEAWGSGEPRGPQYMNVNWIGPAIIYAGTQEQKDYHLSRIGKGNVLWCQGFSEPDAGSDLASMRTAAVRDGDDYVINGQKCWTSYAHRAEFCFLLCRTDPKAERHAGISIFLVPMDTPGIEVREIPSPYAAHLVHEVFFTDVRVPESCRLGPENKGWQTIMTVLANERAGWVTHENAFRRLDTLLEHPDVDPTNPDVSATAGRAYAMAEATKVLNFLAIDERENTEHGKARTIAPVGQAALGLLEPAVGWAIHEISGMESLDPDSIAGRSMVSMTASPIAAGAIEIQFNLIAKQTLQLPKEGRPA
ncbi:acyl-CoA dehydrogenase [Gordonia sp. SID5947]|uniref:acyl-CoA dehydrogenase family protein n=1 Tax=Gordonia sp. SID5947 TaxID=2690315 RepID=UPI00136D949D|nr:acyl-CoA dehydrogenase family protein [Gordonia sp. SID5947]MYR08296.1 acyl-CoA dehydrogenase [Gordonia sp. SID5947]